MLLSRALLALAMETALPLSEAVPPSTAVRLAWFNDALAALEIPAGNHLLPITIDDDGFTNGAALALDWASGHEHWHAEATWLNITERARPGRLRWDTLDVALGPVRHIHLRHFSAAWAPRVGVAFGGNLGGLAIQSGFHGVSGTSSRTDGHGLQGTYSGRGTFGVTGALVGDLDVPLPGGLYSTIRGLGELAVGTSGRLQAWVSASFGWRKTWGALAVSFWLSLDAGVARALDAGIRFHGAYTGQPYVSPGGGLKVQLGSLMARWAMTANGQGTGYPDGAFIIGAPWP